MNEDTFLEAAESGDIESIKELINGGIDINAKDNHERTALLKAAKHGA
ncbi:ankyrin repeat domain-containing protein [Rhodohalobacter sp.]|nr:ankyrin repeat domain-containing protein [Rhodohalobacter sp.]MDZ7756145.1 ankyrin repeat domain-containing protein [Rhodohalobacter sp.]